MKNRQRKQNSFKRGYTKGNASLSISAYKIHNTLIICVVLQSTFLSLNFVFSSPDSYSNKFISLEIDVLVHRCKCSNMRFLGTDNFNKSHELSPIIVVGKNMDMIIYIIIS